MISGRVQGRRMAVPCEGLTGEHVVVGRKFVFGKRLVLSHSSGLVWR